MLRMARYSPARQVNDMRLEPRTEGLDHGAELTLWLGHKDIATTLRNYGKL